MLPVESMLAFAIASLLLCLAPGPDNVFVLAQSALYGKRTGILVTLGLCTGLIVHTTAVALGVAAIFQTSTVAFTALKFAGALYLVYLAWQAFQSSAERLDAPASNSTANRALYRRGIIMNVTNPKVSIFFLAFLPQFASPGRGPLALQMILLGGMFILIAFAVFSAIALMAGALGDWLKSTPRAQIYLNRIAGIVFLGLALKLVTASADGK